MAASITCPECDGVGLIRFRVTVPSHVYGETRQVWSTRDCGHCRGRGKVRIMPDPSLDAGAADLETENVRIDI